MGMDISIHIERREGDRWVNPVELEALFPEGSHRPAVRVCSFSARHLQKDLLFGPRAIASMRQGVPPDRCAELQFNTGETGEDARFEGWCPVEELWLDGWEAEILLLSADVEARFAPAFGHGELMATEVTQALAASGLDELSIYWLMYSKESFADTPEDWAGHRRYQLSQYSPDRYVRVTWRETYAAYAGPHLWGNGLARLRSVENKQRYRILTMCG